MEDEDIAGDAGDPHQGAGDNDKKKGKAGDHAGGGEDKHHESKDGGKGKGKAKAEDVPVVVEVDKKGAEEAEEGGERGWGGRERGENITEENSKRKKTDGKDTTKPEEKKEKPSKQRFLLFLGYVFRLDLSTAALTFGLKVILNIPHSYPQSRPTSPFAVRAWFIVQIVFLLSFTDPPPTVRLLRPSQ